MHDSIRDFHNGVVRQDRKLRRIRLQVHEGNYTVTHTTVEGVNNPTYPISYLTHVSSSCSPIKSYTTINGGTYNVNSKRTAYGLTDAKIDVTGGEIIVTAPVAFGMNEVSTWDSNLITGGRIIINGTTSGYGIKNRNNTISGGEIIVNAPEGNGYGIDGGTNTITGGKIEASTCGINGGKNTITGGTIVGINQNAVSNDGGILNIGIKDGIIDNTSPVLEGKVYGVKTTGTFNFYDGIIKGKTDAIDGTISDQEDNTQVVSGTDGDYKTSWLESTQ